MKPEDLKKAVENYGSPLYAYYEEEIERRYDTLYSALKKGLGEVTLMYAYKANTNLAICRILCKKGAGADVVSGGEILTALKAGVQKNRIIFTNNAKTRVELELSVDSDIIVNIDSREELFQLSKIASEKKKKVKVSFRINPSVEPKTNPKIATGLKDSKFGVHIEGGGALAAYREAKDAPGIEVCGIHMHVGSQIRETAPFIDAAEKLLAFACVLKKELGITLEFIDFGGGIGISYDGAPTMSPEDLAVALAPVVEKGIAALGYSPEIWFEPGRYLVAPAGYLVARVQTVKDTPYKKFINLDAGFNTLIRPAMYDAHHGITILGKEGPTEKFSVAGNVCESGDLFARDRDLPRPKAGDLVAIHDAGAYGFSMASRYNSRPLPAEALIRKDGTIVLIRKRETIDDLYSGQYIPEDLK